MNTLIQNINEQLNFGWFQFKYMDEHCSKNDAAKREAKY